MTQTIANKAKVSFIIQQETLLYPSTKIKVQTFLLCPLYTESLMTTKKQARIFAKFKCLLKDNEPKTQEDNI